MTTPEDILAQVPLFSMLPKRELAKLARNADDRTFPAGTVLTDEEQVGVSFGVVVEGRAAVSVHGRPARTLCPGDYFGEMALIDHSHRSAKITAETELRCLLFVPWVRPFAMEHPETAWALLGDDGATRR
jgi:CRP-like cAMP-binding protein